MMPRVGEGVRVAVADGRSIDHYDDDAEPVNRARALRVFIFTVLAEFASRLLLCIIYNIYYYYYNIM